MVQRERFLKYTRNSLPSLQQLSARVTWGGGPWGALYQELIVHITVYIYTLMIIITHAVHSGSAVPGYVWSNNYGCDKPRPTTYCNRTYLM